MKPCFNPIELEAAFIQKKTHFLTSIFYIFLFQLLSDL